MGELGFGWTELLATTNVLVSSTVVILAFSLLAYNFTYNFRSPVARRFALLLACVMVTYAADVALTRVLTAESANRWLRLQWLGIAMLPAAYFTFSNAVLRTTNYRTVRRSQISILFYTISIFSALVAIFGTQLVGEVRFDALISYLEPGPLFWPFTIYFGLTILLSLRNVWMARERCLTENSRGRMTYLLLGFPAPAMGIFPYLIALNWGATAQASSESGGVLILLLSFIGNGAVATLLVIMAYTVAYFGVLTPDRVVRYRLIRFFMRGPVVAILVIGAVQTLPTVERILGLPRDIVLFSVITGVIILSQLILSVTKSLVDRLIYREDRDEIAWLRELDRRLLTSSDLRQFLDNNLTSLCELLRTPSGFVAAIVGADLILESVVGPTGTRQTVTAIDDWSDALGAALRHRQRAQAGNGQTVGTQPGQDPVPQDMLIATSTSPTASAPGQDAKSSNGTGAPGSGDQPVQPGSQQPVAHRGFWVWPLLDPVAETGEARVLGILGVQARTETPLFSQDELAVMAQMLDRVALSLADRRLQQQVFVALRTIIPGIDRIQRLRGIVPYAGDDSESRSAELLDPSPIHDPEFEAWVKDALSHYWGGPKLTRSPLMQLRVVGTAIDHAEGNPTKALRLVLGTAIERLKPLGSQDMSTPEWLLYNILEMRFIEGRKVREIAERLAMSESDLYRKQRVAIDEVARVLADMEQSEAEELALLSPPGQLADELNNLSMREE